MVWNNHLNYYDTCQGWLKIGRGGFDKNKGIVLVLNFGGKHYPYSSVLQISMQLMTWKLINE